MTPTTLDQRIAKLEARLRRSNMLMCGMVAVFVGVLVMGMGEPTTQPDTSKKSSTFSSENVMRDADGVPIIYFADEAYPPITTDKIVIRGRSGNVIAQIDEGEKGGGRIRLFDSDKNLRAGFSESRLQLISDPIQKAPNVSNREGGKEFLMTTMYADNSGAKTDYHVLDGELMERYLNGRITPDDARDMVIKNCEFGYSRGLREPDMSFYWYAGMSLSSRGLGPGVIAVADEDSARIAVLGEKCAPRANLGSYEAQMRGSDAKIKYPESTILLFNESGNVVLNLP